MPINAGAIGIQPIGPQRPAGGVDGIHRRDDGASGGFRPQTEVSLKTAIEDLAGTLAKISSQEKFGIERMPANIGQIVRNILQQALSMDETLAQGIGSTIESQRFSTDQLAIFARMLSQTGMLADKGFSMELSDETKVLLAQFKNLIVASEGGQVFEPVLLSKAAFELVDSKTAEQLPPALQEMLTSLAQVPSSPLSMPLPLPSDSAQFLKQVLDFLMPRPSEAELAAKSQAQPSQTQQGKQFRRPTATQQLLNSMYRQFDEPYKATPNPRTADFPAGMTRAPQPQNVQQQQQPQQSSPQNVQSQPQQQPQSPPQNFQPQPQQPQQSQPHDFQQQQSSPQKVQAQDFQQQQQSSQPQNVQSQQQPQSPQNIQPQLQQSSPQNVQPQPQQPQSPPQNAQSQPQPQQSQSSPQNVQPQPQQQQQSQPQNVQPQPPPQQQSQPQNLQPQPQSQPQQPQQPQSAPQNVQSQQQPQSQQQQQSSQPQNIQPQNVQPQPQQQPLQQQTQPQNLQPQPQQPQPQQQPQQSQQAQSSRQQPPPDDFSVNVRKNPPAVDEDFIARQMELKAQMQLAKTFMLQQPLQNSPQTTDALKNLAQFLMRSPSQSMSPRDQTLLQNFVNNQQSVLPKDEARHLQNLIRLCQQNVPAVVQQAAVQQKLPDLPRLWAFMQLCDMAAVPAQMSARALKRAAREVSDFANTIRQSMASDNTTVQNQRSFQMMMPIYIGENVTSYPTYLSVYDETARDPDTGVDKKETWLRICVLTDNIGAAELIFRVYEKTQLDMRFYFSEGDVAEDFKDYIAELRESVFSKTPFRIGEIRIGSIGEKMLLAE